MLVFQSIERGLLQDFTVDATLPVHQGCGGEISESIIS
jgi:hypothetical protein